MIMNLPTQGKVVLSPHAHIPVPWHVLGPVSLEIVLICSTVQILIRGAKFFFFIGG